MLVLVTTLTCERPRRCLDDLPGVELELIFSARAFWGRQHDETALVCTALSSFLHAHLAEGLYRAKTDQPCYYQTPLIFPQKTLVHESEATFIRQLPSPAPAANPLPWPPVPTLEGHDERRSAWPASNPKSAAPAISK